MAGDVYVGRDYGRNDFVLDREAVATYCDAVDDHNPIYSGPSPFGGPVAPATVRHSDVYDHRDPERLDAPAWYLPALVGNLHARQEFEFFAPVMVGDAVHTRSFISDRYAKRGRDYVVNEVLYFSADDALVARGRTHQSFLQEKKDDAVVIDRSREKQPGRKFEVDVSNAIEAIPTLEKQITLDMCWKFSGPRKNYHNDRDAAIAWGFPEIVVQGMMSVCFLSEMMTNRFGAGWLAGGKMNVNLVNIVWQTDRLTCRGFVREIVPEGERRRAHLDLWCEKEDGTVATIGTASAVV
jgi:acyl dehydratase